MANQIEHSASRAEALMRVAAGLVEAGEYAEAQRVANQIENSNIRAKALSGVAEGLITAGKDREALRLVQHKWIQADTREHALELLPIGCHLIPSRPEIGVAFAEAFAWVDGFLKGA